MSSFNSLYEIRLLNMLQPRPSPSFQFSLWDSRSASSPSLCSLSSSLSILSMRFNTCTAFSAAGLIYGLLSILSMRFGMIIVGALLYGLRHFQFSLWDSLSLILKQSQSQAHFQFSLWDSDCSGEKGDIVWVKELSILSMRFRIHRLPWVNL